MHDQFGSDAMEAQGSSEFEKSTGLEFDAALTGMAINGGPRIDLHIPVLERPLGKNAHAGLRAARVAHAL